LWRRLTPTARPSNSKQCHTDDAACDIYFFADAKVVTQVCPHGAGPQVERAVGTWRVHATILA
jgi:hypothetical protein